LPPLGAAPVPAMLTRGRAPGPAQISVAADGRLSGPEPLHCRPRDGLSSRGVAFSAGPNFRALRTLSQALLRGYFRDRTALPAIGILTALTVVLTLISVRVFRWDQI